MIDVGANSGLMFAANIADASTLPNWLGCDPSSA